jgi:hypothetical protein
MDNGQTFERIKVMPPLSHWPNRPAPFRWEGSQVVSHIRRVAGCDQVTAQKLFQKAALKKVIVFDRAKLTWSGNRGWLPRPPKRSGNEARNARTSSEPCPATATGSNAP